MLDELDVEEADAFDDPEAPELPDDPELPELLNTVEEPELDDELSLAEFPPPELLLLTEDVPEPSAPGPPSLLPVPDE
jgi:hypothetical protein